MPRLRIVLPVATAIMILAAAFLLTRDDGGPLLPGGTLAGPVEPAAAVTLEQNQPNPFRESTVIVYRIPTRSRVRLQVYNTLGAPVISLVDEIQVEGFHQVEWDGRDRNGNPLPGGIYFYELRVGDLQELRRMVLLP